MMNTPKSEAASMPRGGPARHDVVTDTSDRDAIVKVAPTDNERYDFRAK